MKSQLQEIRERAEKATAGPWKYDCGNLQVEHEKTRYTIANIENTLGERLEQWEEAGNEGLPPHYDDDADFIAHARTDIPKLLAALEKAIEQRDSWASMVETCDNFGVLERENAEIEAILRGEK